jgi:hypothetical protein
VRTISILFALAVIGAAAPAASLGHGLLPTAVLLFACALAGLLAACLVTGWLLCERRTLGRMTGESPIPVPSPAAQSTPAPTWSVSAPHEQWTTRPLRANGSRATALYAPAASHRESLDTTG